MSKSLNICILAGNAGRDPELRTLDDGTRLATFSLATSTGGYKRADGTEVPERTQWHSIVCWRGMADMAAACIHRGDRVTVTGTIAYREWDDRDGHRHRTAEIMAADIIPAPRTDARQATGTPPSPAPVDAPRREDFPIVPASDDLPF